MKQIKIFNSGYLEDNMNDWLKENKHAVNVVDIRVNTDMDTVNEITTKYGYIIYEI